jgi:ribose 5-phosphate isomerase B
MAMRLYFGSDHAAVELRKHLIAHASEKGHEIIADHGPGSADEKVDYPDVALEVCQRVLADPGSFGVLVCGSGQGVMMSANHVRGIRAGLCDNEYSARMIRQHNDANVLCMGARVIGLDLAVSVFDAFAAASFEGGRHARRVGKLDAIADA